MPIDRYSIFKGFIAIPFLLLVLLQGMGGCGDKIIYLTAEEAQRMGYAVSADNCMGNTSQERCNPPCRWSQKQKICEESSADSGSSSSSSSSSATATSAASLSSSSSLDNCASKSSADQCPSPCQWKQAQQKCAPRYLEPNASGCVYNSSSKSEWGWNAQEEISCKPPGCTLKEAASSCGQNQTYLNVDDGTEYCCTGQ
jgi:hypothetical protein